MAKSIWCACVLSGALALGRGEAAQEPGQAQMTAPQWAAALARCVETVRSDHDPDAVYAAYQEGLALDKRSVQLHLLFLKRMLKLGVLHVAYGPAQALDKLLADDDANRPLVCAVLTHLHATRENMPEALKAALRVSLANPDDPSSLNNLGQLLAWYDLDLQAKSLDDATKRLVETVREKVHRRKPFQQAYQRGRKIYAKHAEVDRKYGKKLAQATAQLDAAERQLARRKGDAAGAAVSAGSSEEAVKKLRQELAVVERRLAQSVSNSERAALRKQAKQLRGRIDQETRSQQKSGKEFVAADVIRKGAVEDLDQKRLAVATLQAERNRELQAAEMVWRWDPPVVDAQVMTVVERVPGSKLIPPLGSQEKSVKLLKMAELYLENGVKDKARALLTEIVNDHPASSSARRAADLLETIPD